VRRGFFPLDEELALLPGRYAPFIQHSMARLGTWMPFFRVPREIAHFTGVTVSRETVRRITERSGAALVALETAEADRIEQEAPTPPEGPAIQQLSADGAMIPLVGGIWAEVKTLVTGQVEQRPNREGVLLPHATDLGYFSRLADAELFRRLALVATHRAGTETAGRVCAVADGAEWLQGFVDFHRPDAVRILDFPHAAEHLHSAAEAVFGAGSPTLRTWEEEQKKELREGDPDRVLAALRALPATTEEARTSRNEVVSYLDKRREQIAYAQFREQGYPIGDGSVESANKLVVEARFKGAGMHWARPNVNPLLSLRGAACSDRWDERWNQLCGHIQQERAAHRRERHPLRQPLPVADPVEPVALPVPPPVAEPTPPRTKQVVNGRPTPDHPWRRFSLTSCAKT